MTMMLRAESRATFAGFGALAAETRFSQRRFDRVLLFFFWISCYLGWTASSYAAKSGRLVLYQPIVFLTAKAPNPADSKNERRQHDNRADAVNSGATVGNSEQRSTPC